MTHDKPPPMQQGSETVEAMRKRLAWRASRRGIKEMDILVGGFAAARLPTMTLGELETFAALLEIPDQTLLAWFTDQESVPADQDLPMLRQLLSFRPVMDQA